MSKLGDKLKGWRDRRGLSLERAAVLLGTTSMTLSRCERGKNRPRRVLASRILQTIGSQPALSISWRRAPTLDEPTRAFLRDAARRGIEVPADFAQVMVWRGRNGELLIVPAAPAV